MLEKGRQALSNHTLLLSIVCLSTVVLFVYLLVGESTDINSDPGLIAVLYVVISGISFTSAVYHFGKYRVSKKLEMPEDTVIRAHIDVTREMMHGMKSTR